MALVLKEAFYLYTYVFEDLADPRVKGWFLMSSPWYILGITFFYLHCILNLGPKIMKTRPAYNLDKIMIAYNAIQVLICAFIVVEGVRVGLSRYKVTCQPVSYTNDPDDVYIAQICWGYFMTKVVDLIDTVFIIMRKKESQISFLHIYHHWGMPLLSWCFIKFVGGGSTLYIIIFNSFVHVIMYTYYLLTAYDTEYKKSIWWKKHITQLQLLQFILLGSQHTYMFFSSSCPYPKVALVFYIIQSISFIFLFGDFYYRAYVRPTLKNITQAKTHAIHEGAEKSSIVKYIN